MSRAGYAAGARAIEINPFDIDALALYGAR